VSDLRGRSRRRQHCSRTASSVESSRRTAEGRLPRISDFSLGSPVPAFRTSEGSPTRPPGDGRGVDGRGERRLVRDDRGARGGNSCDWSRRPLRVLGGMAGSLPVEIREEGTRNFLARDRRIFDVIEVADISSATFSSLGSTLPARRSSSRARGSGRRSPVSGGRTRLVFGVAQGAPRENVKILRTIGRALGRAPCARRRSDRRDPRLGDVFRDCAAHPVSSGGDRPGKRFCSAYGYSMAWPASGAVAGGGAEERALREAVSDALTGPPGNARPNCSTSPPSPTTRLTSIASCDCGPCPSSNGSSGASGYPS